MAYRRCLVIRAKNYTQQRFSPSFTYLHHDDDDRRKHYFLDEDPKIRILRRRGFIGSRSNNLLGFGEICEDRRGSQKLSPTLNATSFFPRHMSTVSENVADMFTEMKDVLDVQAVETVETSIASMAPAVSEVAVAAADSTFPVAALQYLIDGVHSFTGLNWWASIAVTTILAHGMITPILIHHYKFTENMEVKLQPFLPILLKFYAELKGEGISLGDGTFDKYWPQIKMIVKETNAIQLTPFYGLLSRLFVLLTFFFAIGNMVENEPSLKTGGAFLFFTDLTTPDNFYILPVLSALTYWMGVQKNTCWVYKEGYKQINPTADIVKMFRGSVEGFDNTLKVMDLSFNLLIIPLSMYFSKAHLCCWITSNLYMFVFRQAMESARVRQFLGLRTKKWISI